MKKQNLKKEYRDLETKVLSQLRDLVNASKLKSKFIAGNCIKVNVFDYVELCIINDKLTFLDEGGYHYSLFCDCTIDDLIDILNA